MRFAIFLPPQARNIQCPALYWLSGLTCTEQNFITKAGAQRYASEHGIILVVSDTSPRGDGVPDDNAYDLGIGAGFYINATQAPWAKHYRMYDYVTTELPYLIEKHFPANGRRSISGHSMGGHGALILALKNPHTYRSVSAFSPIVAPTQVTWGEKAFTAYLGSNKDAWQEWDACALLRTTKYDATDKTAPKQPAILIDQGLSDEFLDSQLKPHLFEQACAETGRALTLRQHSGYDHSYYFISSFIGEHIAYHAEALLA